MVFPRYDLQLGVEVVMIFRIEWFVRGPVHGDGWMEGASFQGVGIQ